MGRVLSRVFEGVQASPPKCPGSHPKIIVINDSKKVTVYWKNHPYATRSVHIKACLRTPYDKENDYD